MLEMVDRACVCHLKSGLPDVIQYVLPFTTPRHDNRIVICDSCPFQDHTPIATEGFNRPPGSGIFPLPNNEATRPAPDASYLSQLWDCLRPGLHAVERAQ